jgi:hypothetical protein
MEKITWKIFCDGIRKFWYDSHFKSGILKWAILTIFIYLFSSIILETTKGIVKTNQTIDSLYINHAVIVDTICNKNLVIGLDKDAKYIVKSDLDKLFKTNTIRYLITGVLIGILIWLFFSFILKIINRKRKLDNGIITLLVKGQEYRNELLWVSLVVVLFLSLFIFVNIIAWNVPANKENFINRVLENPGGLFAFVTGAGTLIGTYFAVRSIMNMKNTITSYAQLVDRLTYLINEVPENSKSGIMMVCYFTRPGYWQVSVDGIKTNFVKSIESPSKLMKIICLGKKDHLKFLLDIAKKKKINSRDIFELYRYTENDIKKINAKGEGFIGHDTVKRIDSIKMPHYYFFVSDARAIIVSPIGLPSINDSLTNDNFDNIYKNFDELTDLQIDDRLSKKNKTEKIKEYRISQIDKMLEMTIINSNKGNAKIQTLGFETTDHEIIDLLQYQFKLLYD